METLRVPLVNPRKVEHEGSLRGSRIRVPFWVEGSLEGSVRVL